MDEDEIPNPVPEWVASRSAPLITRAEPSRWTHPGRRPDGGRRPAERHFPGFDPPAHEAEPATENGAGDAPAPVQEAPVDVEQIVQAAVAQALERAGRGELTVEMLIAERARLIALRATVDEAMRELKQEKPEYWRERRAWMIVVRGQVHNRLHVINRQIAALYRLGPSPAAPAALPELGATAEA